MSTEANNLDKPSTSAQEAQDGVDSSGELKPEVSINEKLGPRAKVLDISPTAKEESRVRWKIDLILMPVLFGCYFLQNLDRQALNSSTMMGIAEDTNLHGKDFSWVSSIFYFGYMAWSYPGAYLMNKIPMGKYLGSSVVLWGGCLLCLAACRNFSDLMAVRFFLGAAEASVAPGFTLITSMFYKRSEQPLRQGIWFVGNGGSVIVASVCSYSISKFDDRLANWKYLFIIYGSVTVLMGILMFFMIPDTPDTAWFFNEREREVAVYRVLENETGIKDNKFNWDQGIQALKDPQAWMLTTYTFCANLPGGGISSFGNYIINGFGFSEAKTLLLGAPPGAMMFGWILLGSLVIYIFGKGRIGVMIFFCMVSTAGMAAVYATVGSDDKYGRLGSYYLCFTFASGMPFSLSLISANIAGFSKRTCVSAMIFIAYCVGNLVGPQMFSESQAPKYKNGISGVLAGLVLSVATLIALQLYYIFENRRRDRLQPSQPTDENLLVALNNATDGENLSFRYTY